MSQDNPAKVLALQLQTDSVNKILEVCKELPEGQLRVDFFFEALSTLFRVAVGHVSLFATEESIMSEAERVFANTDRSELQAYFNRFKH